MSISIIKNKVKSITPRKILFKYERVRIRSTRSFKKIKWLVINLCRRTTSKEALLKFIEKLRPMTTDKPLVRKGSKLDGGYLVPDDFNGIEVCFSPGVSNVSDFEDDCAKLGMEVFLADKSVDGPAVENKKFHFFKKFIGASDNEDFITMDSWVTLALEGNKTKDLMLQMDIEGSEYEALLNTSSQLMSRFRIMVIEFHDLTRLSDPKVFNFYAACFDKILQTHTCVHIHPNNFGMSFRFKGIDIPDVMEFTFLRNDRIQTKVPCTQFPHPLDTDNDPNSKHMVLPVIWYKQN